LVQPPCIVDRAQYGALLRCLGEQAQGREANEEAIRDWTLPWSERRFQRLALRGWDPIDTVKLRGGQVMQRRVASSISDSTPTARKTIMPDADWIACSIKAVFPTPASPRRTSTPLCPARASSSNARSSSRPRSISPPGAGRRLAIRTAT
jgi:hypothetical protein